MADDAGSPFRVLLVEDDPREAELVRETLLDAFGARLALAEAQRLGDALALARERHHDVALLDLSLPDARGLDGFETLRRAAPALPIVVLTGLEDDRLAVEAVGRGAQDYLVKGAATLALLSRAVRYAMERQRLLGELERRALELARLEQQLFHAEKLHALGSLLAGVSHELRTPIGVVGGLVDLLLEDESLPATLRKKLDLVASEAKRARRILAQITRSARAVEPSRGPIALNGVVETTLELVQPLLRVSDVRLEVGLAPDLPPVVADADQLRQVVLNLVVNAVDAMRDSPGGRLSVTTRALAVRPPAEERRRVPRVELAVRDEGPGVPPDLSDRIFEPFFSTKDARGTGLGLSIVAAIVRDHGGTIRLAAPSEQPGATFLVELPAASDVA